MLSILLFIILIVVLATRDRRSKKKYQEHEASSFDQLTHEELSRADYVLEEIASWELQGLIDRELAQKLSQKYQAQKDILLGLVPSTPPTDPMVAEATLHNPQAGILPNPLMDRELYEGKQLTLLVDIPAEILPGKPVEPPKPHFNLLNFLQEKNIKWFNALGTLMLLAAGIIFVATNWEAWNGLIKSVIMVLVTGLFFSGGYFIREKLELPTSGLAFYLVGSFFIPLTFVSFNNFGLFGTPFDWAGYAAFTSLLCMLIYGFMTFKLESQIFAGLTPVAGGAALFALLTYFNISHEIIGIFFVPLSLIYFLAYYYLKGLYPDYRRILLPLPIAANACAALGLSLAAVDFGLGLFLTGIVAAGVYLLTTYLFKQLEYLYVSVGVMILSVFPGVGYFHLPGRSYNLSFIGIAGIALGLSYVNRRLDNPKFEKHFFYAMLGSTCLAAAFLFINGLNLFSVPLKFNPNLSSSLLTLAGAVIIYLLSARLYNSPRYTYVAMAALFAGYAMGLMWLGINVKLYAVFFLVFSAALVFVSKVVRDYTIYSKPVYLSGIAANALVSVLLVVLIGSNPEILTAFDSNLLAGIIAFLLNSALYLYLAYDTQQLPYSIVGNSVFAIAYLLFGVYLGIGQWKWGLYLTGLTTLYLFAEYGCAKYPLYAKPCKYFAWGAMYVPALYYLTLLADVLNPFATSPAERILQCFSPGMVPVMLALVVVAASSIYLVVRFGRPEFTYGATTVTFLITALLFNWLGLEPTYLVSLLMLLPVCFLLLHKWVSHHELLSQPLEFSAIGTNILLTLLLISFGSKTNLSMYLVLSLSLLVNAAVYFCLAWKWKNPVLTWAGIIPSFLTYLHLMDYVHPLVDPHMYYLGLDLMFFALASVISGVALLKREQPYYFRPLLMFGYGLSAIAIGFGFTCGGTLLYPAILGTLLYGITAYKLSVYKEWFWRAALLAANISFGAVLYKLNPHYDALDYVRYFVAFNLLKLALAVYLQYFEHNIKFAWSNYIGIAFTSLLSLGLTFIYGDWEVAALVWSVYGIVYFALAYLLELEAAVYVSAVVISTGFGFILHTLGVSTQDLWLYLSALSFGWLGLSILLKDFRVYRKSLVYVIPLSIGLFYLLNLNSGLDQALLGSLIAAVAMFAHGRIGGIYLYNYLTPIALITGYEAFLLKYHVHFQELYLAPVSLYLIVVSFFLRSYHQKLNYLSYAGLLVFMFDAYTQSFSGRDFLLHALVLGLVATASILLGVAMKHRGFFFLGIIFLLGDVTTQSRSFLGGLQKWFWIGLGGSMFLALGLLFDKKRKDHTLELLNQQLGRFKGWS